MTITPAQKTARGLETQPNREFLHISEGTTPKLPKGEAATFLPVILEDKRFNEWYIIKAGTCVARHSTGVLVYANGGTAQTITYTADDVSYTIDVDGGGNLNATTAALVTAAGAASTTLAANYPIGIAPYHYYSGAMRLTRINYDLQPDVAVLNRGLVEIPLTRTAQDSIDEGRLVHPGPTGLMEFWDPASDSVDQIVGRVIWRDNISAYPGVSALNKVRTVKGFDLAGANTGGWPGHLYSKTLQAGGTATEYLRINLTLLG